MSKTFLFFVAICTFAMLCQWFVFSRTRRYLFSRYSPVTRKVAYGALLGFGIVNLMGVTFGLDPELLPGAFAKQFAAVGYFSYLGIILGLCIVFLLLGLLSTALDLPALVMRTAGNVKQRVMSFGRDETGCVRTVQTKHTDPCPPETHENQVQKTTVEPVIPRVREEGPSLGRRRFLKWSSAAGFCLMGAAATHGIVEAYQEPTIEAFDVQHPKLDGLARPITLLQVTDFHFGLFLNESDLECLVERLNRLDGDAVLLTGDLFHSPLTPVSVAAPILKKLRPRSIGNFAVLGNHDFYAGLSRSLECIYQSGITLLRNEWITCKSGDGFVHLGGVDDPLGNWMWGTQFPGFDEFKEQTPDIPGFKLLLSHRPTIMPYAAEGFADVVLAGHVHGGQIVFPAGGQGRGVSIARVSYEYTHGWYKKNDVCMYVNRGVGLTFLPWRINCSPEILVLHLKPSHDGESKIVDSRNRVVNI
jgi:predicted MPP superfamily phosphohydrolase